MTGLVAYLLLFLAVGAGFILVHLLLGKVVRPAKPDPEKLTIYECGEPTIGSAWVQFDLRFYVVALLFVIFDVEVVFFFPWAVVFGKANQLATLTRVGSPAAQPEAATHTAAVQRALTTLGRSATPDQIKEFVWEKLGISMDTGEISESQKYLEHIDAVRRAVAKLGRDANNEQIKEFISKETGITMDASAISSFKSYLELTEELFPARSTPATASGETIVAHKSAADLAWLAFWDIMVFFGVLLVGFAYLWKRGDLDWVRSTLAERTSTTGPGEPQPLAETEALVGAGTNS
jgi:NADH:ubiquinone oxidoreductase subunit 3 (subunit A)